MFQRDKLRENSSYTQFKLTTTYVLCRSWKHDHITNFKMFMRDEQDRINKFIVEIQRATHTTWKFDRSTSCRCVAVEQNSNLSRRLYASFPGFSPWFSLSWKSRSRRYVLNLDSILFRNRVSLSLQFWGFQDGNQILYIVQRFNSILHHLNIFLLQNTHQK